jgi:flagella basal body P-ring formation protein FlgA
VAGALLLTIASVGFAAGDRIDVRADAIVSGDVVRLRDVANLDGNAAGALGDVVLSHAPGAGEARTLDGGTILQALRRAGLDADAVTYSIPPLVRVRRAAQDVPEAAVRQALEGFLADALGQGAEDASLRTVELPGAIRVPEGAYTVRVLPPPGVALVGRVRLELEFAVADRPVKTVWVTADIARFGRLVVARRNVARGEVLAASDLDVDRRDLSQLPRDLVSEPTEAVGKIARTALLPYAPIRNDQLSVPPTVHRGDAVLLVAERGALRITAPGEVKEDAGRGERVRIVNRASRKELIGRVRDAGTVVVEF